MHQTQGLITTFGMHTAKLHFKIVQCYSVCPSLKVILHNTISIVTMKTTARFFVDFTNQIRNLIPADKRITLSCI